MAEDPGDLSNTARKRDTCVWGKIRYSQVGRHRGEGMELYYDVKHYIIKHFQPPILGQNYAVNSYNWL